MTTSELFDIFSLNFPIVHFTCFFSIHTYIHVQFGQFHEYIQKRNKIYKKWHTQKQSLDIKLFGISRKQTKKEAKRGC